MFALHGLESDLSECKAHGNMVGESELMQSSGKAELDSHSTAMSFRERDQRGQNEEETSLYQGCERPENKLLSIF